MKLITIFGLILLAAPSFANEIPQCTNIKKQCEAAGYEPGDHKKNGKGMWVDCIHSVAKGGTVSGVSATQSEAQACLDAHKAARHEHKKK